MNKDKPFTVCFGCMRDTEDTSCNNLICYRQNRLEYISRDFGKTETIRRDRGWCRDKNRKFLRMKTWDDYVLEML